MKISGFSFVRNAIEYDFPVRESLLSLQPLCDEVVVAVGRSSDDTFGLVKSLDDGHMKVIETVWDDSLREGGRVLAQQTDIALAGCTGDWCIYLQADEVLHEQDRQTILDTIRAADSDPRIEALLLKYHHLYGSYEYEGVGRQWYRREIRIIRNTGTVFSWGDAQGFRTRTPDGGNRKLRARPIDAYVYHYGWVKPPAIQLKKMRSNSRLWHDDEWIEKNVAAGDLFDYSSAHDLRRFTGTHPAVMRGRIEAAREWQGDFDPKRLLPKPWKMKVTDWIEARTGWRIGEYRNFEEV